MNSSSSGEKASAAKEEEFWQLRVPKPSVIVRKVKEATSGLSRGVRCSKCGKPISPSFRICPYCGATVESQSCSGCGRPLSPEFKVCPYCGKPVTTRQEAGAKTCEKCGAELEPDFKFCRSCGQPVKSYTGHAPSHTAKRDAFYTS